VVYNFKKIGTVPTGKDFVDVVLSKTQRKTPTVIHKVPEAPSCCAASTMLTSTATGTRVRQLRLTRVLLFFSTGIQHQTHQIFLHAQGADATSFAALSAISVDDRAVVQVKYTQQTFHDKISKILEEFPRMDDIHPFYADLMNVLYDRDHYKLALGQMNIARQIVDKLAKDYVRMLKYADTLYRAKALKVAALGRMATVMKKHGPSLAYLEQVRQHLSRLPSIDPNARTLLVTGYPNVGKSSFVNKMTNANVEVEPYAFTTKSLYIGHMDYRYSRWQARSAPFFSCLCVSHRTLRCLFPHNPYPAHLVSAATSNRRSSILPVR